MSDETNIVQLDEERKLSSQQEVKASVGSLVNSRIMSESARVDPDRSAEIASAARELRGKAVRETLATDRDLTVGRGAARISQVVDYVFYLIYGVIALQFLLRLMDARPANGFVKLIATLSAPLLAPFERIVGTPTIGSSQIQISYLLALVVYLLLHMALNGIFRLMTKRKVSI